MAPASIDPPPPGAKAEPALLAFAALSGDPARQHKYENVLFAKGQFHGKLSNLHGRVCCFWMRLSSFQRQVTALRGHAPGVQDRFQQEVTRMDAQTADVARRLVSLGVASTANTAQALRTCPALPAVQLARLEAQLAALNVQAANLAVGFAELATA